MEDQLDEVFKGIRNEKLQKSKIVDNGKELLVTSIIREILPQIVFLVSATILQLWIIDGTNPPSWDNLASIALGLFYSEELSLKHDKFMLKPDFLITGESLLGPTFRLIATIDAKNSSNTEKVYKENMTKDTYISQLMQHGDPLPITLQNQDKNSWKAHTHHLLAQVFLLL